MADFNQLAYRLVQRSTQPQEPETPAQRTGREGGLKGGKARAAALTPEQRSEIARKAAQARWANHQA
jgi:general stress protein YciG